MMSKSARVFRSVAAATLLSVFGAGMVGCNSNNIRSDYDAAVQENDELRDRIASLQESVRSANDQTAQAQLTVDQLQSENSSLRTDLDNARQAPPPQSIPVQRTEVINLSGDTLFAPGSAELRAQAKTQLDAIASRLNGEFAGRTVRVEGYTDTDPLNKSRAVWKSNEHLSLMRALAVETYLVSKRVSNDRIYSAGFGPSKPRSTKASSRRVEIVILPSDG